MLEMTPPKQKQSKNENWDHEQKLGLMKDEDTKCSTDSAFSIGSCHLIPWHIFMLSREYRVCTEVKIKTKDKKHFCGTQYKRHLAEQIFFNLSF